MPSCSLNSSPPRSIFFFCFLLLPLLLLLLLLVAPSSSDDHFGADEKITVSLYYESLCPYCADFIVNHLVTLFQTDLISIVNLRMLPWGNSWTRPDGTVVCQHGEDECMLNTVQACTISIYPQVGQHFRLIHCMESLTLERRHNEWVDCFHKSGLSTLPIDCYTSGSGKTIEGRYGAETAGLNPPHNFVPWVVVNNQPLLEDYQNFASYICRDFKGNPKPDACRSLSTATNYETDENSKSSPPVCYAFQTRNLTLITTAP